MLLNLAIAQSDTSEFKSTGFIDLNAYYDTRNQADVNLNLFGTISKRISYFSLTNITGETRNFETNVYFSEQNLIVQPITNIPIKLVTQGVIRSGNSNDMLRFGGRWDLTKTKSMATFFEKINFNYFFTCFVVQGLQGDGVSWIPQIEHVYQLKLFNNRVYIRGFIDQNFTRNEQKKIHLVTEHQLGFRLIKGLYVVGEYRINEYLESHQGLGFGLEYKISL